MFKRGDKIKKPLRFGNYKKIPVTIHLNKLYYLDTLSANGI